MFAANICILVKIWWWMQKKREELIASLTVFITMSFQLSRSDMQCDAFAHNMDMV
jgi:hypothetical protein